MKINMVCSLYIKKLSAVFIMISLLLCSCTNEDTAIPNNGNYPEVKFSVNLSGTTAPKTKSGQTGAESMLNEVDILVFENGNYSYRAQGANIINDGNNNATFTARLSSSTEQVTLYIIANSANIIAANEPPSGASIAAVKALLNRAFTSDGVNGNVALWGSYVSESGISTTIQNTITGIKLLRAVARVDVLVTGLATSNFTLSTIQAFRAANSIQIIPDNPTEIPSVTEPSVPAANSYNINTTALSTAPLSSTAQLYLPESVAPIAANQVSNATCVVVGGFYNNSSTLSYYRLDLSPTIGGHPLGQILRNTRYEFDIAQVNSVGYASPQEAANNPSSGMISNVILWPDDEIRFMFFDDNTYFGLSENTIELRGAANSTQLVTVSTDVSPYFMIWVDSNGVPTTPNPPSVELDDDVFRVTQTNDGATLEFTALTENPLGGDVRERFIMIQAGNLQRIFISIGQSPLQATEWAEANVDMPGFFAPSSNDNGMFYQWNRGIAWPSEGTVTGWNSVGEAGLWDNANVPCPSGWRLPTSDELRLLATSPGRRWRLQGAEYINSGMWFAPTQAEADAAAPGSEGNAVFLPAAGGRNNDGELYNVDSNGYYWASDLDIVGNPHILSMANGSAFVYPSAYRSHGFSIRCVRE